MKNTMSALDEFGLIDWIKKTCSAPASKNASVRQGIGDDTAVLPFTKKEDLLLTTDMSVEDVHFTKQTPPELIGRKALARNLSDIAAMGGTPTFAVVSLGLPVRTKVKYIKKIYQSIHKLAKEFKISIVGGDTVKSEKLVINIALLGKVAKGRAVLRSGARPGDHIFVTGPLGGSLKSGRHLTFTPRIKEAQYFTKNFHPTSMIDISDGLAGDLGHLLEESNVGAEIEANAIPRHFEATLQESLYDGEDFELIFTLRREQAHRLLALPHPQFPFYLIGKITGNKNSLYLLDKSGRKSLLPSKGFTHFDPPTVCKQTKARGINSLSKLTFRKFGGH